MPWPSFRIRTMRLTLVLPAAMLMLLPVSLRGDVSERPAAADSLRYRILVVEDARMSTPEELAPIFEGFASPDVAVVRTAIRAAGRLELPVFVRALRRALTDSDAGVRAEAANSLGQVAGGAVDEILRILRERLTTESDPRVIGTICQTLGRLPLKSADAAQAIEALLAATLGADRSNVDVRLGAARGLDSLIRGARNLNFKVAQSTLEVLRTQALARYRPGGGEPEARVRRVLLTALNAAGAVDVMYERAMFDLDSQVRRLVVAGVAGSAGADIRAGIVAKGLVDRDPMVRYEALRVYGRQPSSSDCSVQIDAMRDASPHLVLLAIDSLATACPGNARVTAALESVLFADQAAGTAGRRTVFEQASIEWLPPAHALVALVRRKPDAAEWPAVIDGLAGHAVWQVRMYAARAAGFMKDPNASGANGAGLGNPLSRFAADRDANVRETAITGLVRVLGRAADATLIAALDKPDYQVVTAVCTALKGATERGPAAAALLRALSTITAQQRDTSRDVRVAILDRLREVAGPANAEGLKVYLTDSDPRVATLAAEVLTALTGEPHVATPAAPHLVPLPGEAVLRSLPSVLRVTMEGGGTFDVRLFIDETPVTVWRILRLVNAGYYNGLTFHRIVPNFVIQGGSPGAHELVGDGPFMRDETSLRSNGRGTVGISTRGRDTGDAQIYINTVDSPRLDHVYPVFGEVIRGIDVVDRIVEGAKIMRIEPAKAF